MNSIFSPEYWETRYKTEDSPWDLPEASPPLLHFLRSGIDKRQRILIPGGGRGYELAWMQQQGFEKVKLIDWSSLAIETLKQRHPDIPDSAFICQDFFQHRNQYDLILEQTFFCALPPEMRPRYAAHMAELLSPGGKLAGVWFNFPLTEKGPPFGGNESEYRALLEPYFEIEALHPSEFSHPSRKGKELFILARRKSCLS
jgi:SAM-dependent methyltransferase